MTTQILHEFSPQQKAQSQYPRLMVGVLAYLMLLLAFGLGTLELGYQPTSNSYQQ